MKRTVDTSVFYDGWLQSIPKDLRDIKKAITEKDFENLGEISEANCLKMHATTLGAVPHITYWQDDTMTVMETVQYLRKKRMSAYVTIDAGPNVKVLYTTEHEEIVVEVLKSVNAVEKVIVIKVGSVIDCQ